MRQKYWISILIENHQLSVNTFSFLYIQFYFAPDAHSFTTSLLDSGFAVCTSAHIGFLYLKDPIYLPQRIGDNYKLSSFIFPRRFFDYMELWWRWTSMKYRIIGISQSLLWDIDNLCQEIRVRQDFPSRGTNWLLRQLRWWMYMGCMSATTSSLTRNDTLRNWYVID